MREAQRCVILRPSRLTKVSVCVRLAERIGRLCLLSFGQTSTHLNETLTGLMAISKRRRTWCPHSQREMKLTGVCLKNMHSIWQNQSSCNAETCKNGMHKSLNYLQRCVHFKGMVHPNIKVCWKCNNPQVFQDEFVFMWTDLEKCSITSLAHQWILCNEWVPSEWESKQLIETSQKSTSDRHHSSPSINILWSEKLRVCKKQIHPKDVFNFKPLLLFYESPFISEKSLKQTNVWWTFSLHKTLTNGLDWSGLLVDYCDGFFSGLDSHSDGTHSLQRIHWWASDAMLHFSKSILIK